MLHDLLVVEDFLIHEGSGPAVLVGEGANLELGVSVRIVISAAREDGVRGAFVVVGVRDGEGGCEEEGSCDEQSHGGSLVSSALVFN